MQLFILFPFASLLLLSVMTSASLSTSETARIFANARYTSSAVDVRPISFPDVTVESEADGYAVQKEYMNLSYRSVLGSHIGWKIGATNEGAQAALKFGPFYGPLWSGNVVNQGDSVSLRAMGQALIAGI